MVNRWISLRVCSAPVCQYGFAILFAGWTQAIAQLNAAPASLHFEAIVNNIVPLNGNAIPVEVESGDRLHAQITFESVDVATTTSATNTIQDLGAEFRVRSTFLHTEAYFLNVSDNTPIDGLPPDQTADNIFLGCSATGFVDCQPSDVPNAPMVRWDFGLSMFADGGILDGADIPDDAAVWNQFLPASLVLTFRAVDGTDLALVAAGIESFVRVPEPTTGIFALLSGVGLVALRIRRTVRN